MQIVNFNKCLNKERKLYGLSYDGVLGAGIIGLCFWTKFGMTTGMICSAIAYTFCAYYANLWHIGSLQRFIYWNLPIKALLGNKYLPESYRRCFA
jgi:hypothetical protein